MEGWFAADKIKLLIIRTPQDKGGLAVENPFSTEPMQGYLYHAQTFAAITS